MSLFYCYLIVLLTSAVTAVGRAGDLRPSYLRRFALFLPATVLIELAGLALRWAGQVNHWLYNLYIPLYFLFYSWLYYFVVDSPLMRRVILWSAGVFTTAYLANLWAGQGLYTFNSYSYLLSSFLLVVWVLSYFQQTLRAGEPLSLTREPIFWISTGLLFLNLGHFLYLGLLNYLLAVNPDWARRYGTISILLNILNYSLFTVAFLCQPRRPRQTPHRSTS